MTEKMPSDGSERVDDVKLAEDMARRSDFEHERATDAINFGNSGIQPDNYDGTKKAREHEEWASMIEERAGIIYYLENYSFSEESLKKIRAFVEKEVIQ